MVKIKICGITNMEDAQAAVAAGCHALGFVFYKKSPRYIMPQEAAKIIKALPKKISKVGVFVDASQEQVRKIAGLCRLDMLQFHGSESPEFCCSFKGYKVIKALRVKDKRSIEDAVRYNVFALLFDTFVKSKAGGTGKIFDWKLIKSIIDRVNCAVFLSGGLNTENIGRAIKIAQPDWVDVSSSVEIKPGKKDAAKMKIFIKKAKGRYVTG